MKRAATRLGLILVAVAAVGCIDRSSSDDREPDAASAIDSTPPSDASMVHRDATVLDAATRDASRVLQDAGGDADADADLAVDAGADAVVLWLPPVASDCPDGPGMAGVHMPDGRCYLIDSWFVTQQEYYLATRDHPPTSSHPHCVNHAGAGPRVWLAERYSDVCVVDQEFQEETVAALMPWPPPESERENPMYCLTWCDAAAYCESVGKRLCGGVAPDETGGVRPEADEWLNACTGGGMRSIPFASQDGVRCRTLEANSDCEGGFEGVWMFSVDASSWPRWARAVHWETFTCQEWGPGAVRTPEPSPPDDFLIEIESGGIRCCADEPVE